MATPAHLKKGKTVMYPHHGAAKIIEISDRVSVKNRNNPEAKPEPHLLLRVDITSLEIWVPQSSVMDEGEDAVPIRKVIDDEQIKEVKKCLRAEFVEEPTNWSRRFKANKEKLDKGEIMKVAEVVRDLWRRDQDKGLSAGEKNMLGKARQTLESEWALAKGITLEAATAEVEKVLSTKRD
ncbi:MAG: hypothetical protein RLZ71_11 [Actinomycetota bacterium]|jgi:CarD family transcriptional regulator